LGKVGTGIDNSFGVGFEYGDPGPLDADVDDAREPTTGIGHSAVIQNEDNVRR
jgi:hypothetical protein